MNYVNNTYKDLIVWQKSVALVIGVYKLTDDFPKTEIYGLVSQMRRCSVSIPSNIAEGRRRCSGNDFRRFLTIAFGSGAELETQIVIAKNLKFGDREKYIKVEELLDETMRMLNKMINNKD